MGRIFVVELEGIIYRCKFCKTHLVLAEDLISRAFHCRRGRVNASVYSVLSIFMRVHTRRARGTRRASSSSNGRIVDELDFPSDFYIDICPSMSDAEEN